MNYFELYLILSLFFTMILTCIYCTFVVKFVTPRVDKFNGQAPTKSYMLNFVQTCIYIWAFNPPAYLRKNKQYMAKIAHLKAAPRDLLFFKAYKYCVLVMAICFVCMGALHIKLV